MSKNFQAGVWRAVITPPVGSFLTGYVPRRAEVVYDNLAVTAAAFTDGERTVLVLSVDVCLLENRLADRIRSEIRRNTGVPAEAVILSATHMHSGPVTWDDQVVEMDHSYCDGILIPRAVEAAERAMRNLSPAQMGVGTVRSEVGVNRRQIERDGTVCLGQNPWGIYDPTMTVLSFRNPEGKTFLNIIHYGAHATASGVNHEITRDWPGPMIDRLTAETHAVTLFLSGASGDVGPRLLNGKTTGEGDGGLAHALELGARAAEDAVSAYRSISEYVTPQMDIVMGDICLPYTGILPLEEAEAMLSRLTAPKAPITPRVLSGDEFYERLKYTRLTKIISEYESGGPLRTELCYRQTLARIGRVVLVPFPFEIFSEIALRMRSYSPFQHTLCLGNANGSNSYLPTQDQFCRGGYEVETSRLYGTYTLREDTDETIIKENLRILEQLR